VNKRCICDSKNVITLLLITYGERKSMANKYVFFVNGISAIGGGELYTLRKTKHLTEIGFEVYIVAARASNINFEEFFSFTFREFCELRYVPNFFSEKLKNKVIDDILRFIDYNENDEILIESHEGTPALWAELFAERVRRVNLVYCISPVKLDNNILREFYYSKIRQGELAGYEKYYIPGTFGSEFKDFYFNIPYYFYEIDGASKTRITECNSKEVCTGRVSVLTVSRIEKSYVKQSIIDLANFCRENPNVTIKYKLILSKDRGLEFMKLKSLINKNKVPNFEVILHGPVRKMTSEIFEGYDLFIGMGTSVLNAVSMGIPAVVVDYRTNKYYGFFGYDYFAFGACQKVAENELGIFLNKVLRGETDLCSVKKKALGYLLDNYDIDKIDKAFIEYQYNLNKGTSRTYFKTDEVFGNKREVVRFILLKVLGPSAADKIIHDIVRIKRLLFDNPYVFK